MWRRLPKHLVIVFASGIVALAILYGSYRLIDPLPPRHFAIAVGTVGSVYDNFARRYAQILARDGVTLEVRNSAGARQSFELLRDATSGVQAALSTFDFTQPGDANTLSSLGGVFDAVMFVFYRNAEPISKFAQFRGKRLAIGMPETGLRSLILQVLRSTDALDETTYLVDLDYSEAVDALIAGKIDVAIFPSPLDGILLQRALGAPGIELMNVTQSEAIAKRIPGLKHVVFWRGLSSLSRDIPNSNIDLLASRNRLLVRKDLHPALQYLLLKAMREVHSGPGPFHRLGEFPAEQPNDLPLSSTAETFYRSGSTFWQRNTSFWVSSLLDRIMLFVIPVVAVLIPIIGFAPRCYRWLNVRRIDRLHRALGNLQRELGQSADKSRSADYQARIAEIESSARLLKVARPFETNLHILRLHLRMVQEDVARENASRPQ